MSNDAMNSGVYMWGGGLGLMWGEGASSNMRWRGAGLTACNGPAIRSEALYMQSTASLT